MKRSSLFQILVGIGSVLILNFLLSFSFSLEKWFRISADLLLLLPFLGLTALFSTKRNFLIYCICTLIFIIGLYRFVDKLVEFTFHRSFVFSDIFLLPELNYLMSQSLTNSEVKLFFSLIVIVTLMSYFFILFLTRLTARAFKVSLKKTVLGVFMGLGLISLVQLVLIKDPAYFSWTRGPLTVDIVVLASDLVNFIYHKEQISKELKLDNKFMADKEYNLSKLAGTNVIVIFLESYGAILVEEPELIVSYKKLIFEMQAKLETRSFSMVSGYSEAPDSSWLSRLSFSTGTRIDDRASASLAMLSRLTTLNQKFSQNGYSSLSVMPGVEEQVLKIESFFGFREKIRFWNIDWPQDKSVRGWAKIPDQYVLDWLGRKPILKKNTSVYAEIILSSSHSPYGIVPPYITNKPINFKDYWTDEVTQNKQLGIFPHLTGSYKKYMLSIEYSLRSVFEFIERYLNQECLIILIGDHQPPGLRTHSSLVPVHVISYKPELLVSFKKIGFETEVFPPKGKSNITHGDFAKFLLESYSCCEDLID